MIILNPKAQISANFTISLTHSLRLGDAYMRRQSNHHRLVGAKPLSEPMLEYC